MTRPTLVTGAAGFAGSHLLDLLGSRPEPLVGWHRPGLPRREQNGVSWEAIDALDRSAVTAAIRRLRPLRVYHCAGAAHVGHAWNATTSTLATNVLGTHYLIEALRAEAPDARLLIPSSAQVYGHSDVPMPEDHRRIPSGPYGLSKLAQEMLGEERTGGPEILIARPFNHIGPRQEPAFASASFAKRIAEIEAGLCPPEIEVGNLEPKRDLTDVRDTVRAYSVIIEKGVPGRAYNVCSGRAVGIGELLDALLSRAHAPIKVVVDPGRYRPSDQPCVVGDLSRIRHELGWVPAIPFERTLDDLLDYWRGQIRAS